MNSRRDRGLHLSTAPHDDWVYWRWNSCEVAGFKLGPLRTMAATRKSPWSLRLEDLWDSSLFGVQLEAGRVALVDGVASWNGGGGETDGHPTQPWDLVGTIMEVKEHELVRRIVCDPGADLKLKCLNWEAVLQPVLLICDMGGTSMTVIDPNLHFNMIPITYGRLMHIANQTNPNNKVMQLVGFTDLEIYCGPADEEAVHECNVALFESARQLRGKHADHSECCRLVAQWKPQFSPKSSSGKDYSTCAEEMYMPGAAHLVDAIFQRRILLRLPTNGLNFVDVGFGAGNVLAGVAIMAEHLNWSVGGVEMDQTLHAGWLTWLDRIREECFGLSARLATLQAASVCGMVGSANMNVTAVLGSADVVFTNNICFNTGGRSRQGMTVNANGLIAEALCTCRHGTLVITTAPLGFDDATSTLQFVAAVKFPAHSFSWTQLSIEGFMYEVTSTDASSSAPPRRTYRAGAGTSSRARLV